MLKYYNDDTKEEFVLLPLSDFIKMNSILNEQKKGINVKMVDNELLVFLSTIIELLNTVSIIEFSIIDDTVTLDLITSDETDNRIQGKFSTDICKKYYAQPLRFIFDVL